MSNAKDSSNLFKGPTFRYGPGGEKEVFHHSADVPEGWLDNPAKHSEPKAAPPPDEAPIGMTRDEIVQALEAGGIEFKAKASDKKLHSLLVFKVKEALSQAKVEFDDACTDAKTLLGLLPPSE